MKNRNKSIRNVLIISILIISAGCGFYNYFSTPSSEEYVEPIKVACIGDSLTFRRAYEGEKILNYSEYLSDMLGEAYFVKNFGEAGVCVRDDGNYPYRSLRVYSAGVEFEADILVVMIGTNDIWDYNWLDAPRFKMQYLNLIDSYLKGDRVPEIYLCTLPKIYDETGKTVEDGCGERVEILSNVIREIASERGYTLIEMNKLTAEHPEWYCEDNIHFSNYGAKNVATEIVNVLLE